MQLNNYVNPEKLTVHIACLANPETSWEKEEISLSSLDRLIKNNMRLILGQTENAETAPKLQQSLFDLSNRISNPTKEDEEKFNTPEWHNLAFEVTTIAMGIFTDPKHPPKPEWTELPPEVLRVIFSKNPPKNSRRSELEHSGNVSKEWNRNSEIVEKDWIDQGVNSLRTYGCKNAEEAIQYVIDNNLSGANLKDFPDLTDTQLTKLIENCPRIIHLILPNSPIIFPIIYNSREFPLIKLTNLKTLSLFNCFHITKDVLSTGLKKLRQLTFLNLPYEFTEIESLKELSKLTHLRLFQKKIRGYKLLGTLKSLTELTSLDLDDCGKISVANLVKIVKSLTKLLSLNLSNCSPILGNRLAEVTKNLPQLTDLELRHCYHIPKKRMTEALKNLPQLTRLCLSRSSMKDEGAEALQNLSQLTYLDLSYCSITEVRLDQLLQKLPKLKGLNLKFCCSITKESIDKWQKEYPDIKLNIIQNLFI